MRFTFVSKLVFSFLAVACLSVAADDPNLSPVGMVYTMTNAVSGNAAWQMFCSFSAHRTGGCRQPVHTRLAAWVPVRNWVADSEICESPGIYCFALHSAFPSPSIHCL